MAALEVAMVFIAGELSGWVDDKSDDKSDLGKSGSDLENAAICLCQVIVARTCLSAVCLGCTAAAYGNLHGRPPMVRWFGHFVKRSENPILRWRILFNGERKFSPNGTLKTCQVFCNIVIFTASTSEF